MTVLRFRSPVTLPVHPQEWVRPAGNTDFRVTQTFDQVNPAFPENGPHRATDLGNFRCGDTVVAMESGTAQTIGPDSYGALGIIITHAGGVQTVYWHLQSFIIARGNAVPVTRGQQIAIVGKTGLGAVCHLHTEVKVDGVRIDPEPYIFGASMTIEDDEVQLPRGLSALTYSELGAGNNIRSEPKLGDEYIKRTTTTRERIQVFGPVPGDQWTIGGKTGNSWWWIGANNEDGFVAGPLIPSVLVTAFGETVLPKPPPADCSVQDAKIAKAKEAVAALQTGNTKEAAVLGALEKVLA